MDGCQGRGTGKGGGRRRRKEIKYRARQHGAKKGQDVKLEDVIHSFQTLAGVKWEISY